MPYPEPLVLHHSQAFYSEPTTSMSVQMLPPLPHSTLRGLRTGTDFLPIPEDSLTTSAIADLASVATIGVRDATPAVLGAAGAESGVEASEAEFRAAGCVAGDGDCGAGLGIFGASTAAAAAVERYGG